MSADLMRKLITLVEDAQWEPTASGGFRRIDTTPPAKIEQDEHGEWTVIWTSGPYVGEPLTQRMWRAITGTHAPRFGLCKTPRSPISFPERDDAEKAVATIVPILTKRGWSFAPQMAVDDSH